KYVIIDDDDTDRKIIELEANKFPFLELTASFENPVEALEILSANTVDLLFLDIEMPGMSGIDFLKKNKYPGILTILITSHPEFALESFDLEVFDYLLKPVSSKRFATCALRIEDFSRMKYKSFAFDEETETNFIIIKQGHDKFKILIQEILYIEAMGDYTRIFTVQQQYLVLSTLNSFAERLPPNFVRIHRSYIVNSKRIESVQKNKIFIQLKELPVGKLYKHTINF
ncbi:MAG: LytTR family DNA-binding domain-containing protein, partial [Chitinophagaceae bacterium]